MFYKIPETVAYWLVVFSTVSQIIVVFNIIFIGISLGKSRTRDFIVPSILVFLSSIIIILMFKDNEMILKHLSTGMSYKFSCDENIMNIITTFAVFLFFSVHLIKNAILKQMKLIYIVCLLIIPSLMTFVYFIYISLFHITGSLIDIPSLEVFGVFLYGITLYYAIKSGILFDVDEKFEINTILRLIDEIVMYISTDDIVIDSNIERFSCSHKKIDKPDIFNYFHRSVWNKCVRELNVENSVTLENIYINNIESNPFLVTIEVVKKFDSVGYHSGYTLVAKDIRHQVLLRYEHNKVLQLNRELREQFETDYLTQIGSRMKFEKDIDFIFANSREGYSLFIMMIDIDLFKLINDNYGHKTGDIVLTEAAKELQKFESDNLFVYRWAGDEFVVIAYNITKDKTYAIAEKMRSAIEQKNFSYDLKLTISIGVSDIETCVPSSELLTVAADKKMYISKSKGKNRVT